MKSTLIITSIVLITIGFLTSSFTLDSSKESYKLANETISLKIKGTGSKQVTVKIGIGTDVGKCERGCYKTIGPNTTVSIQANVGDIIWDADSKTKIFKVTSGMNGDVIDLKSYY